MVHETQLKSKSHKRQGMFRLSQQFSKVGELGVMNCVSMNVMFRDVLLENHYFPTEFVSRRGGPSADTTTYNLVY